MIWNQADDLLEIMKEYMEGFETWDREYKREMRCNILDNCVYLGRSYWLIRLSVSYLQAEGYYRIFWGGVRCVILF